MNFTKYNFKNTTILTKISLIKPKLRENPAFGWVLRNRHVEKNIDIIKCRHFQMSVSTDETPMLTSFMAFFYNSI